ncbi:hypothetical protein QBC46DRAFT_342624 [Diplogelasinospora grovesii]|uniref:Uncharacterized protein n=1 Tax=Diplogelasinospora grovesii TaxID=303347 RepID=A0AAN6N585_9PEZI|nr:hypothetical protein QBC46DRAFT_342624 [Diplogelasinospora grovesii]
MAQTSTPADEIPEAYATWISYQQAQASGSIVDGTDMDYVHVTAVANEAQHAIHGTNEGGGDDESGSDWHVSISGDSDSEDSGQETETEEGEVELLNKDIKDYLYEEESRYNQIRKVLRNCPNPPTGRRDGTSNTVQYQFLDVPGEPRPVLVYPANCIHCGWGLAIKGLYNPSYWFYSDKPIQPGEKRARMTPEEEAKMWKSRQAYVYACGHMICGWCVDTRIRIYTTDVDRRGQTRISKQWALNIPSCPSKAANHRAGVYRKCACDVLPFPAPLPGSDDTVRDVPPTRPESGRVQKGCRYHMDLWTKNYVCGVLESFLDPFSRRPPPMHTRYLQDDPDWPPTVPETMKEPLYKWLEQLNEVMKVRNKTGRWGGGFKLLPYPEAGAVKPQEEELEEELEKEMGCLAVVFTLDESMLNLAYSDT